MDLQKNKDQVFAAVAEATQKANRPENSVSIVAVTKYVDSSTAKELVKTGVKHIGENRADKFLEKYQYLKDEELTWHLIGTLQRRKVNEIEAVLPALEKLEHLEIVGIMTMAPIDAGEEDLEKIFQATHELQKKLQDKQITNMPFSEISMGMSRDFATAIANGSTFVRIGTSFFK